MHIKQKKYKKKTKYFYNKSTNVHNNLKTRRKKHNSTQFMLRYNKTK